MIGFIKKFFKQTARSHVPEAAASIAFFALFAILPLILVLVAVVSWAFENKYSHDQILTTVFKTLPFLSDSLIADNLNHLMENQTTMGLLGFLVLIWACLNVFHSLVFHIGQAWPTSSKRNFLINRLFSMAVLVILSILMPLFFFMKSLINVILHLDIVLIHYIPEPVVSILIGDTILYLFIFIGYGILYKILPPAKVKWSEALFGSCLATFFTGVVTVSFRWFVTSGFSQYSFVYGSLGALIALMTWIYLICLIVLWGAHFTSIKSHH